MNGSETICAIATPLGTGGIGIIRLSGPLALSIGQALFSSSAFNTAPTPRYVYYGAILHPVTRHPLDEGCMVYFQGPQSYTGEDVVEIQGHSSPFILKTILQACLDSGARLATKGEFTKRAFIHGKMDLTKAESVIDLIHAHSSQAQSVALDHLKGSLHGHIQALRKSLMLLLEHMEGSIDFPDEIEPLDRTHLQEQLQLSYDKIHRILHLQDFGKHIRSGVLCVIVGKPNVGKSSLLNQFLGENRAIVSQIAGTTRDFIEADIELGGLTFRLIDTAGVREAQDTLERLGIKKVKALIEKADVVLWVVDGSQPLDATDEAIYKKIKHKKTYWIVNKCDKPQRLHPKAYSWIKKLDPLLLSAKKGLALETLKKCLYEDFSKKTDAIDLGLLCNVRQSHCLAQAHAALSSLITSLRMGFEDAVLAIDLKQTLLQLGEITGDSVTEEVLDGVFSRFCVGK